MKAGYLVRRSPRLLVRRLRAGRGLEIHKGVPPDLRSRYVTVEQLGTVRLRDCEESYRLIGCPTCKWNVGRTEVDRIAANFQGNPLWPRQALNSSPALCEFLGLHACESVCCIPFYETFNAKLRQIADFRGKVLFALAPARPVPACLWSSERAYVDGFIDARVLPMARALTRDSMHDWSYHAFSLLFPDYLENLRCNLAAVRSVYRGNVTLHERTWNYFGHSTEPSGKLRSDLRRELLTLEHVAYRQMAIAIDVATAKFIQFAIVMSLGLIGRCSRELRTAGVYMHAPSAQSIRAVLPYEHDLSLVAACCRPGGIDIPGTVPEYIRTTIAECNSAALAIDGPLRKRRTDILQSALAACQT